MSMIVAMSMESSATPVTVQSEEGFTVNRFGKERIEIIANEALPLTAIWKITRLLQSEAETYGYGKVHIKLNQPCSVLLRGKYKVVSDFHARFFISATGHVCYTVSGGSGPYLNQFSWYAKISAIVLIHPDHPEKKKAEKDDLDKLFNRVCKARYDEKTWSDLKKDSFHEKKAFYYIDKIFDRYDMERICKGFEEKSSFSIAKDDTWQNPRVRRHYKVQGKMCDDGIYRAWFSSEYAGCANGDYYLLLNPRVAVFSETD
jgi:hypothetical protein